MIDTTTSKTDNPNTEHFTNEVFEQIWEDRYKKNGETYDGNLRRVAKFCAKTSAEEEQFYKMMRDNLFFPGGRTMSNAGIGSKLTLNNCNVAPIIGDSMDEIFQAVTLGAKTHQRGGGIGYEFSHLRPAGTPTSNDAVASGPVSFMDVFNAQTATILQGGRRGANMGVLSVYHPDIEEFINAKANDNKRLNHFNLSVMVDDAFMHALLDDEEITLHWPVYGDDGRIIYDEEQWKITKVVKAKELWDKIIRKAYDNGEPGVLFFDRMNDNNPLYYAETIHGTNPCFTGDMELLTADGYKTFKELSGRDDVRIITADGGVSIGPVWSTGIKDVVAVKLSDGRIIKCTPNHVFRLSNGRKCKAINLVGKTPQSFGNSEDAPFVLSVEPCGQEEVYDFNEPLTHWGIVNGVVAHNCGEYLAGTVYNQKLPSNQYGGACNLGSLMLHNFVLSPFTPHATLNYWGLKETILTAVRMLDNIIDVNSFPDPIYKNYQETFRTVGLGVTGVADMLCMLGLKYDSEEAVEFMYDTMDFIAASAYAASARLAQERGVFPAYDAEAHLDSQYLGLAIHHNDDWQEAQSLMRKYGLRNGKLLAVAPTGTMSLVYGNNCSSGIEPIFSLSYDRKVKVGSQSDDAVKTIAIEDSAYRLYNELETKYPERELVGRDVFRTALEISVDAHLNMLDAVARHVDMSVSKTINIPTDYTFEQTKDVYIKAWQTGSIKGCTIFRPNDLRPGILIESKPEQSSTQERATTTPTEPTAPVPESALAYEKLSSDDLARGMIEDVPAGLTYRKYKVKSGCGAIYCFIGIDENERRIYDFFTNTDGVGGCTVSTQATSRLMSACVRGGVPVEYVIEQLQKSGTCPSFQYSRGKGEKLSKGRSCPSAIAYILQDIIDEFKRNAAEENANAAEDDSISFVDGAVEENAGTGTVFNEPPAAVVAAPPIPPTSVVATSKDAERLSVNGGTCPECKAQEVVPEGGCLTCKSCGWSKCG